MRRAFLSEAFLSEAFLVCLSTFWNRAADGVCSLTERLAVYHWWETAVPGLG